MVKRSMFMWEWQHIFRGTVEFLLKDVLSLLPFESRCGVFLLGIPANKASGAIFSEPENIRFVQTDFGDVIQRTEQKYTEDPERNLVIAADHIMARHKAALWPKALREAVLEILREHEEERDTMYFCSFPVRMNEHWVVSVVQIERKAVESLYRLQHERQAIHPLRDFILQRSLLDAAVHCVLAKAADELRRESRGENISIATPERILEDAAEFLMSTISMRTRSMGGSILNLANAISAERYEGAAGRGRLLLARQDHPDISATIRLKSPVHISQYRGIRKLLETSSEELALLSDGKQVWGLGIPKGTYDPTQENLFELRFTAHYKWELLHADNVLMQVAYRRPRLPTERFDKALFHDHVERLFKNQPRNPHVLTNAVQAAVEQKHGTIVVITPRASAEADRLATQSTLIEPEPITRELVRHVSRVDGAMLLTPDGIIHAFGVILDGVASANGTPSRGARFNSAIRYIDGQQEKEVPCLALIVSEDGYVDLYPKLRPQIHRRIISSLLDALEFFATTAQAFDPDAAWDVLSKLDRFRFYLLQEDVERANTAKLVVLNRLEDARKEEVNGTLMGYILPSVPDFIVSSEMSDAYYKSES